MWGFIFGESICFHNFNFSFPTNKSNVLLHLTHWQYWFWFWFTFFIVLYFILFLRLIRTRSFNFKPRIMTSLKSHGKWGDILVCLIPISWCSNILSNSNFILRMIEWQTELCLFTLRVRGKQWYWVYKFEFKLLHDIINVNKNIGNNHWFSNFKSTYYYYFIVLKGMKSILDDLDFIYTPLDEYSDFFFPSSKSNFTFYLKNNKKPRFSFYKYLANPLTSFTTNHTLNFISKNFYQIYIDYYLGDNNFFIEKKNYLIKDFSSIEFRKIYSIDNFNSYFYIDRLTKEFFNGKVTSIGVYNNNIVGCFSDSVLLSERPQSISNFLVIKQKRKTFGEYVYLSEELKVSNVLDSIKGDKSFKKLIYLKNSKALKLSVLNNRRLLRTRRMLILPSGINIGIITNSFDVIHSWYIPGLGIKLDCVPGRSTHHTINIDHVGFYYGQCAEICGRYHHHMPIRICVLTFDHFLLWWYNYGTPYFFDINVVKNKAKVQKYFFKYDW